MLQCNWSMIRVFWWSNYIDVGKNFMQSLQNIKLNFTEEESSKVFNSLNVNIRKLPIWLRHHGSTNVSSLYQKNPVSWRSSSIPVRGLYGTKYSRMDCKICERQPLKNWKGYGLLKADHIPSNFLKAALSTLAHIRPCQTSMI